MIQQVDILRRSPGPTFYPLGGVQRQVRVPAKVLVNNKAWTLRQGSRMCIDHTHTCIRTERMARRDEPV